MALVAWQGRMPVRAKTLRVASEWMVTFGVSGRRSKNRSCGSAFCESAGGMREFLAWRSWPRHPKLGLLPRMDISGIAFQPVVGVGNKKVTVNTHLLPRLS